MVNILMFLLLQLWTTAPYASISNDGFSIAASSIHDNNSKHCNSSSATINNFSALELARRLKPPEVLLSKGGEFEGHEFWEEHDDVLSRAWGELGPRHKTLYTYDRDFEHRYMHRDLRDAAHEARAGQGDKAVKRLFQEVVPGVFASDRLFTEDFLQDVLSELDHIQNSGIPQRRPNGMNRYGVILDNVGLDSALMGLVDSYIRPLAGTFFPEFIGAQDADEKYAFTVRYESAGDTELAKHGDASVATLNICLGQPGWTGGDLEFYEYNGSGIYQLPEGSSAGAGRVVFRPGLAVLHRGQHQHQAMTLQSGVRTNLIIWLFARHGVVRVAPYPASQQLTLQQHWQQRPLEGRHTSLEL